MRFVLWLVTAILLTIISVFLFNNNLITFGVFIGYAIAFSICEQHINDTSVPFIFRDIHDKIHFLGSFGLSIFLTILASIWVDGIWCYGIGVLSTNILGLIYELLQWLVLPSYQHPWFVGKPWWIVQILSSDQKFDPIDVKYNLIGSVWFFGIYYLFVYLFFPAIPKK